jgi:hypothetical protein
MVQKQPMLNIIKNIKWDIKQGRYNKFPTCCVTFYSFLWSRISDLGVSTDSIHETGWWRLLVCNPYNFLIKTGWKLRGRDYQETTWNRIPCPKCIFFGEPTDPIDGFAE